MGIDLALKKLEKELEQITRRGMKEQVVEYLSNICYVEQDFIVMIMNPEKSLLKCIKFINEKAMKYLKDSDESVKISGGFGGDVPDTLCFEWAVEYYKTPNDKLYPAKVHNPAKKESNEVKKSKKNTDNNVEQTDDQISLSEV